MSASGRMDENAIAALLAKMFRGWDRWGIESCATHGAEVLIRQEASRLAQTVALLDDGPEPRRLVEIGTGYLALAITLRHQFPEAEMIGVEHPRRPYVWLPEYRARLTEERIRLIAADLVGSGLPFRSQTFDVAVFAEVVEHLPPHALPSALAEISRILAPRGVLVLTTPNLAAWSNRELLLRGHSPQQSPSRIIDGTYGHLRLYTMAELVALLEESGFKVVRRTFIDQVAVGISLIRRVLRALLWPARVLCPSLRDTCMVRAVRVEGGFKSDRGE